MTNGPKVSPPKSAKGLLYIYYFFRIGGGQAIRPVPDTDNEKQGIGGRGGPTSEDPGSAGLVPCGSGIRG
jgi:hypothetical protein